MPRKDAPDDLASLYAAQKDSVTRAGRRLHDDVGPLLAAAGLKLQLLRMDVPESAEAANETLDMLDAAFEHIRGISQELLASPVYRGGLKNALLRLAEQRPEIDMHYTATSQIPLEAAVAIYDVIAEAVDAALAAKARSVRLTVSGTAGISARVTDDGRLANRKRILGLARTLAAPSGVRVELATKDDRIVSIRYALRRPPRG